MLEPAGQILWNSAPRFINGVLGSLADQIPALQFILEMTAEELEGSDDEYVTWTGEYQLMQRLVQKLERLQGIEYGDSSLFYADKGSS